MVYHVRMDAAMKEFLETAVTAARLSGDIIIENLGRLSKKDVRTKKAFDFVTKVDRSSEESVMKTIRERYPGHRFLTEESLREEPGGYRWIIDPLDGTTNYIHGYPMFSVSIALEYEGKIVLGAVFDPLRGELFHAVRGGGAFLNGAQIHVSDTTAPDRSLVATGFPFRAKEMIDHYLVAFRAVFERVSDIRRAGSAALDLAYVAAGRVEGFFELRLSPWDIAAGSLLVTEAGGVVTDFGGGRDYLSTGNVIAGNIDVHPMLLETITKVFGGIVGR
jgi:myo-inositol-1(or 4)-monophosphatase